MHCTGVCSCAGTGHVTSSSGQHGPSLVRVSLCSQTGTVCDQPCRYSEPITNGGTSFQTKKGGPGCGPAPTCKPCTRTHQTLRALQGECCSGVRLFAVVLAVVGTLAIYISAG